MLRFGKNSRSACFANSQATLPARIFQMLLKPNPVIPPVTYLSGLDCYLSYQFVPYKNPVDNATGGGKLLTNSIDTTPSPNQRDKPVIADFKKIIAKKEHGFTLIELIIVIIVVGILAALGISQYSKIVEKSRGAEARMILGQVRKLAFEYYFQNGTITGITDADVNIGTESNQIPSSCRSTHYFKYRSGGGVSGTEWGWCADRCASGGKSPQGDATKGLCLGIEFTGARNTSCDGWGKPCSGADCWVNTTNCGHPDY